MQRTIEDIKNSIDLAELLNTYGPLTEADATETPVDWPGIALPGADGIVTYETDLDASTPTRLVLADGHAAVDYKTAWHITCPMFNSMPEVARPHWCPADRDTTTWEHADAVVTRDWRSVYVGQASFSEFTVHDTIEAAQQAYEREVEAMEAAFPTDEETDD